MKAAGFSGLAAMLVLGALIPTSPVRACEVNFAIQLVDGEAGLQPSKPNPHDIKVTSDKGHAYWLQPDALVRGDIVSAEMSARDDGDGFRSPVVNVRFGAEGQRALAAATAKFGGRELAYVLNGQIIGEPVVVDAPLTAGYVVISGFADATDALDEVARLRGERCPRFAPSGAP